MSGVEGVLTAPQQYVGWINRNLGFNPRAQRQSLALSGFIVDDWRAYSPTLAGQFATATIRSHPDADISSLVVTRNVDLALLDPTQPGPLNQARVAVEHKTIMTAHGRARKNRWGDLIAFANHVHNHNRDAIAAATVVINTSLEYVNPDRLTARERPVIGNFPRVIGDTIALFQNIPLRDTPDDPNDIPEAVAILIVAYDGVRPAQLITVPPAPQPGQRGEYAWFLQRLDALYHARFP